MSVLVLNAGYEPLHTVSVKHAMNMLWRGVATVEESHPEETFGPFPMPTVLRLVRYVKMTWAYARRGVLKRDHGQCAYCGQPVAATMDHVVPKSRGGSTTWDNAVAACEPCNQRKADRTPDEAGMTLLWEPFVPTREDLAW